MLIETPNLKAFLIGDPHFGRDFRNGTPLHRRGEREKMQRAQFLEELNTPDVDVIIMVGDLFDKPFVPLPVLSQVIGDVVEVAQNRPEIEFFYMAGNHDLSRQIDTKGAWQIFDLAVSWLPNVTVVNEPMQVEDVALFPWQWNVTAAEQVERFEQLDLITAVVGHWDMKDFGGDTSHLCPVAALKELYDEVKIYSGHYHEEKDYVIDGVTVHCTGSLQPYAHGEGDMYVTLTLEEALAQADDLKDKCVRILLEPGEVLPEIDCLQLTKKAVAGEGEEIEIGEIGLGGFDIHAVLTEQFDEHEVPTPVRDFIKERIGAFS